MAFILQNSLQSQRKIVPSLSPLSSLLTLKTGLSSTSVSSMVFCVTGSDRFLVNMHPLSSPVLDPEAFCKRVSDMFWAN